MLAAFGMSFPIKSNITTLLSEHGTESRDNLESSKAEDWCNRPENLEVGGDSKELHLRDKG